MERRTARLVVRPLRLTDRGEWVRAMTVTRELAEPWMPRLAPGTSWDTVFDRALAAAPASVKLVGILDDGRIGGWFSLNEIVRGPFRNAYAGWGVNAEVAGLGIATEGVLALLDLAFAAPPAGLGLHRVQANIIPRNARSIRVAEKAGFRREGVATRYLEIAGIWEDHAMYAKVCDEHVPGR
jgi:ribosomal-protein-alanine N-acetyltransferase